MHDVANRKAADLMTASSVTTRIKVLQVITHLSMGGAENVALQLVTGLSPAMDFTLFAVQGSGPDSEVGRDMLRRCNDAHCPVTWGSAHAFKSGGALHAAWRLIGVIAREKPDVIHLHCEIAELVFALSTLLRPSLRRHAVMRTVHNCTLWIDWERLGRWVTRRLDFTVPVAVSMAAARADLRLRQEADPSGHHALAATLYNGVDAPPPLPQPKPDQPFRLLFAGRLVHQKGADLVPPLLMEASRICPDVTLDITVAGQGMGEAELAAGLARLPPHWHARIIPPIARLDEKLSSFDALLMPSRFEGFGLLALEALLAGVPLITTTAPGLDEILPTGYPLAAPVEDTQALGQKLAMLIRDPQYYRDHIARLRPDLARRFSCEAMLQAYAQRYHAMARKTPC